MLAVYASDQPEHIQDVVIDAYSANGKGEHPYEEMAYEIAGGFM
jgi:hypothetical protein